MVAMWVPAATLNGRLGTGAVLAVFVLLVHSAHAYVSGTLRPSADHAVAAPMQIGPAMAPVQLIKDDLPMAGCMMLELAGSRLETLVLAAAPAGLALALLGVASPRIPRWDAAINPHPPPGSRRQALLGVFLT